MAPVSGAQRRQHWIRGEEGTFMLLSSSQKAVEAGGSQLQGNGGRGGENIFFLPFKFQKKMQKSRANDFGQLFKTLLVWAGRNVI